MLIFKSMLFFLYFYLFIVAHPVTWKHGNVFQFSSSNYAIITRAHHSFSAKHAFGLTQLYQKKSDTSYFFSHSNWLIRRWNTGFSQANIYATSGVGLRLNNGQLPTYFGLQADWETKMHHVYFKAEQQYLNNHYSLLRFRYGFAPYEGAFNDWHTWVFFQVDDRVTKAKHQVQILPVLRFFRHQLLLELGFDFKLNGFATVMFHF